METKKSLEETMTEALEQGEMRRKDPEQSAVERLLPRYEIRVKAAKDPIVEETGIYRGMAEEVDDRYETYLDSIPKDPDRNPRA